MSVTAKDDQGLGWAVRGDSQDGIAVVGASATGHGVYGECHSTRGGVGVFGTSNTGDAVRGETSGDHKGGVVGISTNHTPAAGPGVYGESDGLGVWGVSHTYFGVAGQTDSATYAAVLGRGRVAGRFEGDVQLASGNLVLDKSSDIQLANGDGAEEFEIAGAEAVEPGTVMVLSGSSALLPSCQAYDKRVAGIVSGAGDYRPAMVLDRRGDGSNRQPIALFGKVFCKVDAAYGPVEIGDLLTTSPTPGHAMKAADPARAFGAVIGKALGPLAGGQGLIPVLVSLQ